MVEGVSINFETEITPLELDPDNAGERKPEAFLFRKTREEPMHSNRMGFFMIFIHVLQTGEPHHL